MKKKDNIITPEEVSAPATEAASEPTPTEGTSEKKKPSTSQRIYKLLDTAEKIAIALVKYNEKRKKAAKKKKKKYKKVGKLDKKSGNWVLKKQKPEKPQKPMKRYKAK